MKRITHTAFAIAIAATLAVTAYFYLSGRGGRKADEPVRYRALEAVDATNPSDRPIEPVQAVRATASIPLESNETLLDLYSFNLDYDDEEEQVLVVRDSDDATGVVKVVLADYSPFTRKWTRAWKGSTLVTKNKTFQVSVNDLIGDHNLNIVCTGMDDANNQTMTVYWKSQDADRDQEAAYVKILEQAGSAVLVEGGERPDSYKLGQSNAESWPVSVWKEDPVSGNYLDQIKETWHWSFADEAYVLVGAESIPGASIARQKAESILDGTAETFKAFLDGTWYKESIDPLSSSALFITFQSRDEAVLFSGEGLTEVYSWENSNPTRYGLYIASRNQSVRNLRRLMDIELASADSVSVRVFQDYRIKADISGKWDGRYRRLTPDIAASFRRAPAMARNARSDIGGLYESEDGTTLSLIGSEYILKGPDGEERGAFSIYELQGKVVLDMRRVVEGDGESVRRSWIATAAEARGSDGQPTQTLTLQEATIGILGIEPSQSPPLSFKKR